MNAVRRAAFQSDATATFLVVGRSRLIHRAGPPSAAARRHAPSPRSAQDQIPEAISRYHARDSLAQIASCYEASVGTIRSASARRA